MMRLAQVFLCCMFFAAAGCTVLLKKNRPDARIHAQSDIQANFEQTRLRMRSLVQPMSGVIVSSADQIMATTSDRAVRREALLWKMQAVPALHEALFQPNPMTAAGDAWAFTFQMADYFDKGPGARAMGEARGIALAASQRLEAEMARVAASLTISGDVSRTREYVRNWAASHPITQSIAARESALSDVMEKELAASFSTTELAGNIMVSVDDLNRRLDIYSAQVPDQSRWQAELFAMDMAREHDLAKALPLAEQAGRTFEKTMDSFARVAAAVERSVSAIEKALPLAESAV